MSMIESGPRPEAPRLSSLDSQDRPAEKNPQDASRNWLKARMARASESPNWRLGGHVLYHVGALIFGMLKSAVGWNELQARSARELGVDDAKYREMVAYVSGRKMPNNNQQDNHE